MDSATGSGKRSYSHPILRKPNREQTLLFLLGHAWDGDPIAKEVLELVFPDPSEDDSKRLSRDPGSISVTVETRR